MNKRMHIRSIEVVFLVPCRRRQHDVRIQASGGHAEVQRHQQIQLALGCGLMPDDFFGFDAAFRP